MRQGRQRCFSSGSSFRPQTMHVLGSIRSVQETSQRRMHSFVSLFILQQSAILQTWHKKSAKSTRKGKMISGFVKICS
jgi:hypothetical protein